MAQKEEKQIEKHDKYLNLFYSYNQGSLKNEEKTKQLEDNLTRALIVTLQNLNSNLQKQIIGLITDKHKVESKGFSYDLQNTDKYNSKNNATKYIIILERQKIDEITKEKLQEREKEIKPFIKLLEAEDDKAIWTKKVKQAIKDEKDLIINSSKKIEQDKLNALYQFIHDNRPDAWILGEKEVLLIETKIGSNQVLPEQIYRHITGKNGLQIGLNNPKLEIINIIWEDIQKIFRNLKPTGDKEQFLINQFLNYISMTGQTLDFNYLIEGNFDEETHKAQFELFLSKFDDALESKNIKIKRNKRNKDGLWEPYSIKNEKGQFVKYPHFTISFPPNEDLSISLTLKPNSKQVKSFVEKLKPFYEKKKDKSEAELSQYFIHLVDYRLVDWKKGQIRGEKHSHFAFLIHFSKIGKQINEVANAIESFEKLNIKQLDFGIQIQIYDFDKINKDKEKNSEQIRAINKRLLENPEEIIKMFADFVAETIDLHEELSK